MGGGLGFPFFSKRGENMVNLMGLLELKQQFNREKEPKVKQMIANKMIQQDVSKIDAESLIVGYYDALKYVQTQQN